MNDKKNIDYGPLTELTGVWQGAKGMDVAPEPDGSENSPYYETITYTAIGQVTNADTQVLSALHYRQIVQQKSNNEVIHDETGYWMWDPRNDVIMHTLVIPRGVCVIAGGNYSGRKDAQGNVHLEVAAQSDAENWKIIQSPFMRENAKTIAFRQSVTVGSGSLSYSETTVIEIYGKVFEHTDQNELLRQ